MSAFVVAANWKMHKTRVEARAFVDELRSGLGSLPVGTSLVLFPSFTGLADLVEACAGAEIEVGAQNLHPGREGAFTGEVSARQIVEAGASWVLVGHSERRHVFAETDARVGEKLAAAREDGLRAILCVGETEAERERGETERVLARQLSTALAPLGAQKLDRIAVAYEPVWAIGTGRTASVEQVRAAHQEVRRILSGLDGEGADAIPILYGGSVQPANSAALGAIPEVGGLLVGGASLVASTLLSIARTARPRPLEPDQVSP